MRYLLTLVLGTLLGGVLVFYYFIKPARLKPLAGATAVQAPAANSPAAGTALVTLDENFFNTLLGAIFRDLNAPTFQLARATHAVVSSPQFIPAQGGCNSQVVIVPEGGGVRTSVRINDGKITAPLAFNGTYSLLGTCLNFKGVAEANIQLSFDQGQQTLYGQIDVDGVNLENANPAMGGIVTLFVRRAINERVNPLPILRAQQLALAVPIQASGGTLKAQVKEVRAEIVGNALQLHINYDFNAARNGQGT